MKSRLSISESMCSEIIATSGFLSRLRMLLVLLALGGLVMGAEAARGPVLTFGASNTVTMAQGTVTNFIFTVQDDAVGWSGIQTTTATFLTNGAFPSSILAVTNIGSPYSPPNWWTNAYSYETNGVIITPGNRYGTNVIVLISTDIWGDSTTNRLLLNVYHVSQPPSFTLETNILTVLEESGAQTNSQFITGITNGAGNPPGLTWTFAAGYAQTTNGVIFKTPPAIIHYNGSNSSTADLTFAPTNHSAGSNLVTVTMTDSGYNINGGHIAFTTNFWLVVARIVHPPVISWATNRTTLENSIGLTNVVISVSGDSPGSTLGLTAVSQNTNIALASVTGTNVIGSPSATTNTQFTLALTPVLNGYGTVTNQLIASEVSGTNTFFTTNYLVLTVTHVSQPPSFTLATNVVVLPEESGPQTNSNFVRNISVGAGNPAGTLAQFRLAVVTATNLAADAQFTVMPSITVSNGILTFTPKAHSFGTNVVTVTLTNTLESTNFGGVMTFTTNFLLEVTQTSHVPTIAPVAAQTMLENRGATNVVVNVWNYDAVSNNLALTAVSQNTNIALVSVTATNVMSATNTQFTLLLSPVTNSFGTNTILLTASELVGTTNTSSTNFALTLTHVSQAPRFVFATNPVVVSEQATATTTTMPNFLTSITNGAGNLPGTNWTFTVTAGNTALFASNGLPAIAHNGTLTFTQAKLTNGSASVTVVMKNTDAGESTTNGGVITFTNAFGLTISYVTTTPSFAMPSVLIVPEHAGLIVSNNFLTGITAGLGNPPGTPWTFAVSCPTNNPGNATFAQLPTVTTNGTLSFAASDYSFGTNTVTIVMSVINGGLISYTNSFTLEVPWVNQPPSFGLSSSSITVNKYNVPVTVSGAAVNIAAGPPNETNQTVNFLITDNNSSLFTTQPAIDANGNLTFTPGNQPGIASLQIQAHDNGGTANGGVDTSTNETLTITIPTNTFLNATGTYAGVFYGTNTVALDSSGYFSLLLDTNGAFTGYLLCGDDSNAISGQFGISNYSDSVTSGNYALNLTINTAYQAINGSVSNTAANWQSSLVSYLSGYGSALDGTYLAVMPGFINPKVASLGDSVFNVAISNGVASLTGKMADSNQVSQTSSLCTNGYYPIYIPLYTNSSGANGLLIGWMNFNGAESDSTTPGSALVWISETNATVLYPNGFTNSTTPLISTYDSTQSQLLPINKGYIQMSGGDLTIPVVEAVSIVNNQIIPDASMNNGLSLTMNAGTGEIQGSFVDGNGNTNEIESVMLQNDSVARGYFQDGGQSGSFILVDDAVQLYAAPYPTFTDVIPGAGITDSGITNVMFSENAATNNLSLSLPLYDPLTNGFNVTCSSGNTNVVSVYLTGTNSTRTLWFVPVTNEFGSNITITVTADDSILTNTLTLNLTVALVNHAPSFTLSTNAYTVDQYDAAVSVPNAVTDILAGPPSENYQTVSFNVTNNRNDLFTVQPSVDTNGTLTFTANNLGGGTATVQITAQDNGGTANGGVDTSAAQTITITIPSNPFGSVTTGTNNTGTFTGLFSDTNATTPAMPSSGYFDLTLASDGSFNGYLVCLAGSNAFSGQFDVSELNATVTIANYALNLTLDPVGGTVTGTVTSTSPSWSAAVQSYLAASPNLAGDYLVALPGLTNLSAGPVGNSVFNVAISSNGVATLSGYLADNTAVSLTSEISGAGNCPIYAPLYTNGVSGLLFGWLNFTNAAADNLMASSSLTWFNAAGATPALYPAGFTNQAVPMASIYNNTAPNELSGVSFYAVLTGGDFGADFITNAVTIVNDNITVDPTAGLGLSLTINPVTGEIQGAFVDNDGATNEIEGMMLQDTNIALGYFTDASGNESGSFALLNNYPVPAGPYPIEFTGITNVTMLENASTVVMPFAIFDPLTTNIASVVCTPASTNVTVSVTPDGTGLSITPAANFSGTPINFTVTAIDGNAQSNIVNFSVTVSWVNQAPSFNLAAGVASGITVSAFDAPVIVSNAATDISSGPGNNELETNQTVDFIVTNSAPGLFTVDGQPAIDATGTLTFTPGNQGGTVTIGVQIHDNGGTANGGVDTSAVQMFTITIPTNTFANVTSTNTGTGTFVGLLYDTNGITPESSGYFTLTLTNDGTFNVNLVCAAATNSVSGQFSTTMQTNVTVGNYILGLTLDTTAGTVMGSVSNSVELWDAELQSYLVGNTNMPAGSYNLTTEGFDDVAEGPTGDNIFNVVIDTNGVATVEGYLADNTPVSQASPLSAAGYCPIYIPLYPNGTNGVLIGWLNFTNDPSNVNVVQNSILTWINESNATPNLYSGGFTNIAEVQGSSYITNATYTDNLLGASSGSSSIGFVMLSGGDLGANPVVTKVGITNNVITVILPANSPLSLSIAPSTGMVQGWYIGPNGASNNIEGAILQNGDAATGYFMGVTTNQSGLFMLLGD